MNQNQLVAVVGLGEIGKPLLSILSRHYECVGIDVQSVTLDRSCSVLHVCYPFQIPDFIGTTVAYINKYNPELAVINNTVAPGTTERVQSRVPCTRVVYSPVRGKHAKMEADLMYYKKFVAGSDPAAVEMAVRHFSGAGFKTDTFPSSEVGELSKLLETTYLAVLIAWAQEVERLAAQCGGSFDEVNRFIEEISFLPCHIFPGVIGGHCVMPNIAILKTQFQSEFLLAVEHSNELKRQESLEAAVSGAKGVQK
jgi:UDP-N-acetyl-D-mannosaminuronate dehydrogenase